MVQAITELELGRASQGFYFYFFCGWVVGLLGGWKLKLKLMQTQLPTELGLELGLSLAKKAIAKSIFKILRSRFLQTPPFLRIGFILY